MAKLTTKLSATESLAQSILENIRADKYDFSQHLSSQTVEQGEIKTTEYVTETEKASIKVIESTKDWQKNARYTVEINAGGAEIVITGKYARRTWSAITNEPKERTKKVVSQETIDAVASALGL